MNSIDQQEANNQRNRTLANLVANEPERMQRIAKSIALLLENTDADLSDIIEISDDDMMFCRFRVEDDSQEAMEYASYIMVLLK
jgi:hypothetical protein